jgi:putative redox protein
LTNGAGATAQADEPAALGGDGEGFNPYELVAAGLGACTAITLLLYARRKNQGVEGVIVDLRYIRAGDGGTDRDAIERVIRLSGELDASTVARMAQIARKCPVFKSLGPAIEIRDTVTVAAPSKG